ncbi:thiamine biosynthesis protein ThiS [Methylophilaceae bacterium 11]|jgi:sulfur carrier protein|uniref:sulfur carrier protein ThiS n=1 Tax=unclassified Methylotenera TaxID=2643294 RepID=UPI00036E847D|nr:MULTISPECIES: sulfur carrier protein ThiS [unclassified Methylotenera]EUJ11736.1 thiamine biosynthesis protein ThiS [Methylophilaceae bacterium 11]
MHLIINGKDKHFDDAALSVSALVVAMDLAGKRIAIERNGEIVPRSLFDAVLLNEGDQLEIVGAVGGG